MLVHLKRGLSGAWPVAAPKQRSTKSPGFSLCSIGNFAGVASGLGTATPATTVAQRQLIGLGRNAHSVSQGFLRMQAIQSANEISRTSGRRRSTLLRRSLQPDGGPKSSFLRSSPERLFFLFFIACSAYCQGDHRAKRLRRHSLFQLSGDAGSAAVKNFTC